MDKGSGLSDSGLLTINAKLFIDQRVQFSVTYKHNREVTDHINPISSLKEGHWFKLICGASFQHLPAVSSLTLAYTLAGADCIDVAADPAVIAAAQAALQVAKNLAGDAEKRGFGKNAKPPLLMVSLNDGEDPHFRKAEFNPTECPTDCDRPCEKICPVQAIVFNGIKDDFSGVVSQKCYGCGRCLPACPYGIIYTRSYVSTPGAIAPLVMSTGVNAVEIHTQVERLTEFKRLWQAISPWADRLKVVSISCPDGDNLTDYLHALSDLIAPINSALIWQTDGRPMSGDIGDGTTHAAVKLAQKVLAAKLPGYVQLAGGTNSYTVAKLKVMGLLKKERQKDKETRGGGEKFPSSSPPPLRRQVLQRGENTQRTGSPSSISGIAYGSYARVLLSSILEQLETKEVNQASVKTRSLEEDEVLLWQAVELAYSLVSQLKSQQER